VSRRTIALLAAAVATVAACGGSDAAPTTTEATTTTEAPTTTEATTTTEAPTTTEATTTTAEPEPEPAMPLTGLPITDPAAAARPALVVKIDNNSKARPQSGLNAADIVFEEIVEVQTRFAAVFQSQGSDPVGPIRSGRTQDIDLLGSFNRPLFAWSGGNPSVTRAIANSDFINLSALTTPGYFRTSDRQSPHDLYSRTTDLWSLTPFGALPPQQHFDYLEAGEPAAGSASPGVDLDMDTLKIEWRFDTATGLYARSNGGRAHNDAASGQITTTNVMVMVVEYRASPADRNSPEAQTIGSGQVVVLTGGKVVTGTWSRADRLQPWALVDDKGNPIELTPGRTWVELAEAGTFTVLR
jgi:hypothetical protein